MVKKKILIVDDDKKLTDIVQKYFIQYEFNVVIINDGKLIFRGKIFGLYHIRAVNTGNEEHRECDRAQNKLDYVLSESPAGIKLIMQRHLFREDLEGATR